MSTRPVAPRMVRVALLATMLLLVVQLLPAQPARAAVFQRTVGNTTREFSTGQFQRTSLALLQSTNQSLVPLDQNGAVQLAPIGMLRDWNDATFNLPAAVSHMGATALGNRIFVIGGRRFINQQPRELAEVRSAAVDLVNGTIVGDWENEPDLPAVQHSVQSLFTGPVAPVESPAIATVDNATGNDYIYVIGGTVSFNTVSLSSFAVRRATVVANGKISNWTNLENARIPSANPDLPNLTFGASGAAVTTYKAANGNTYIYLLGGLQRYCEGGGGCTTRVTRALRSVYYTQVSNDGRLLRPGTNTEGWTLLNNTPIPLENTETAAGIWDAVAVAARFPNAGDGLFLIGGQEVPDTTSLDPVYSSVVYRAQLGPNGGLSWVTPSQIGTNYTLPEARYGHGGALFNGNIYLTGGQPQETLPATDKPVLTSYVTGTLELPSIGDGGSQFLKNDVLPAPRSYHGTVLVKASEDSNSSAFIYVLGGVGSSLDSDPLDDSGTSRVFFGRIGGSEDIETDGYVPDGWFYSTPESINFDNALVQKINWTTLITRTAQVSGMDVGVDYRISLDGDCTAATWTESDWRPLSAGGGVRSASGNNSTTLTNVNARCFQYRARLYSSRDRRNTPSLLGVSIEIFVPGSPDLKVNQLAGQFNGQNQFTGLKTVIINKYEGSSSEPTLRADIEGQGQFFVELLVFAPGQTPVKPSLPINLSNPNLRGYVRVSKAALPALATFEITTWCISSVTNTCTALRWRDVFPSEGTYNVMVAVDSYCPPSATGCVNESLPGAEANNVSDPVQIVIQGEVVDPEPPHLYLPIIRKVQ